MRLIFCCALLGLIITASAQFNPDSFVGRLVVSAVKSTIQKRSLNEIIGLVSGIAGNVPGLTILGPNGGINLPELLSTVLPLFTEVGDGIRCCKTILIPHPFMDNLVTCIQEPAELMGKNISRTKELGMASMVHPPVSFQELATLMQGQLCAMKCTFNKLNKLGMDGLPNADLLMETLDKDFLPEAADVVKVAIEMCDKEMRISQKGLETEMREEDKCWASNAMVGCLLEKFHEHCPPEARIRGNQCLANFGPKFWADLPGKLRVVINDFKGQVLQQMKKK